MPINYSISPNRIPGPAKTASSKLPNGYLAHPDLDGSYAVSMQELGGPAFLRKDGVIKPFYSEQAMIDYCRKHAAAGLSSDQSI